MTVEILHRLRKDEPSPVLRELDDVVLLAQAETLDGARIASGSEGTVVGIWDAGTTVAVEFAQPEGALVTVPASGVRWIGRHAP